MVCALSLLAPNATDSPKAKKRRLASQNEGIAPTSPGSGATAAIGDKQSGSPKPEPTNGVATAAASATIEDSQQEDKLDDRLTFPERLMHMLQHEVEPKALWWQKDGLSFGFEPKLFTEKVLNKLFPTKIKFESFIRKLNRW